MASWYSNFLSADKAEVALRAGQLELEKQATQQLENIKAQAKETLNSAETMLKGGIPSGSGATEDRNKKVLLHFFNGKKTLKVLQSMVFLYLRAVQCKL